MRNWMMCWHFLHSYYVEWHGKTKWRILLHFITCSTASSETQVAVHHSIVVCHFYFQFSNYLSLHSPNFMHMFPFSMATIYFLMQLFEHIVDVQWVTLLRNRFSFPLPKTWLFLLAGWLNARNLCWKTLVIILFDKCVHIVFVSASLSISLFLSPLVHSFTLSLSFHMWTNTYMHCAAYVSSTLLHMTQSISISSHYSLLWHVMLSSCTSNITELNLSVCKFIALILCAGIICKQI